MERTIRSTRSNTWQGSNWIRQDKRLAIMMRDGLHCMVCGKGVENGASLTLDHITPASVCSKPKNGANNLYTCCSTCNSSRGNRLLVEWMKEQRPTDWQERILTINHNRHQGIAANRKFANEILQTRSITRYTGNGHCITVQGA